ARLDATEDTIPAFFDAWRHQHSDHIAVSLLAAILDACGDGLHETIREQVRKALGAVIYSINFKLGILEVDPGKGRDWLTRDDSDRLKMAYASPFDEICAITHKLGGRRIVVLIDDLDRCSPRHMVKVLEAIKVM